MIRDNCNKCGKLFWKPNKSGFSDIEYCDDCIEFSSGIKREIENEKTRSCVVCNEVFTVKNPSSTRETCSKECRYTKSSNTQNKKIKKKCCYCDKEYYVHPYYTDSKFCSQACYGKMMEESEKDHALYPNTRKLRRKVRDKQQRENLGDWYIKSLIQQSSSIDRDIISKELIELKRLNVKRKRLIKNHNQKS